MLNNEQKRDIKNQLKDLTKDEIIEVFLKVVDHLNTEMDEIMEVTEYFFTEAMELQQKRSNLLDEIKMLEKLIKNILGIEKEEIVDDCECETCGVKDLCEFVNKMMNQ